jgi:DNA-binding NtrC family response regulator
MSSVYARLFLGGAVFNSCQLLIVSSDSLQCQQTEEIARRLGLQTVRCSSLTDARSRIEEQPFQLILCGDDLPDCNLRTAVRVLTSSTSGAPVIVLSHLADWDAYMKALSAGAFDYIACPPDPAETERILRLALAQNPPPRRASRTAA